MKRCVEVRLLVEVEVDESKFTDEFLEEYRQQFYPFPGIDQHVEHLAQMAARGLIADYSRFIEGYGPPEEMGIKTNVYDVETETVDAVAKARAGTP